MAYSPKYVSLSDIPVQIPDDYSNAEKADALEVAESAIEADLNEGRTIDQSDVSALIEAAIRQKGTCELAKGSEHPDDTALGDLSDTGDTKVDYAHEAFCDEYDELVDKILGTEEWADTGGSSHEPYHYTTGYTDPEYR